jgi:hypothetical protein
MTSFLFAYAVGLGIILSFAGWGWLFLKVSRSRFETGFGSNAVVGLAFTTPVGALLNWFALISPAIIRTYVLLGIGIAVLAAIVDERFVRHAFRAGWAYFRPRKLMSFGLVLLILITAVTFAAAVSPNAFHPQDDLHAYFVYPAKMLQTGQLGSDPFSERRIISSLGDKYFLDTFLMSFTGSFRNMFLIDMGVGYVLLLLLLAEILHRRKVPGHWAMIAMLTISIYAPPVSNITAIYLGVVLVVLMFDLLDRTAAHPESNSLVVMALLCAGVSSLKGTFMPSAAIYFLSFFAYQWMRTKETGKTLGRAGLCLLLVVLFMLPWMLYSLRVSATLFYPLFGKGYHGSVYGIYLLPTANPGLHNLLAFLDGLSSNLGAVVILELVIIVASFFKDRTERLVDFIIVINFVIDFVVIGIGIGGVQMYRYSFPVVFAFGVFFLVQELAVFARRTASGKPLDFLDSFGPVLVLGMLLGGGFQLFMDAQKQARLKALNFGLSGRDIDSPKEIADYRALQDAVPAGAKILVRMDKNYLFDFRRNTIWVNDLPGGASLPPGIPIFKGPEVLADYLVQHGIRYLGYSYGDEASFTRAEFSTRLAPKVNIWIRRGAEIAFDFQDNALALGKTRKKLYDNGSMFVLDLETPAGGNTTRLVPELAAPVVDTPKLTLTAYSPAPDRLHGPVLNVNPTMSNGAIEGVLARAPRQATILFAPGTYEIGRTLTVPCNNGLTLMGPQGIPATATLKADAGFKGSIFAMDGCTSVLIQFLHFDGAGALYVGKSANSGITFVYNQITNVQGTAGIYLDGYLADTVVNGVIQNLVQNVIIERNTIGDDSSCRAEFAKPDDDGDCAGIITHAGELKNLRINYNSINHMSEGIHIEQLTTYKPGATNAVCVACRIEYNYIYHYHRIGFENQVSAPTNPIYVQHNVVNEPIGAFWGTFAMSMACCVSGFLQVPGASSIPSLVYKDNVTISTGAGGGGHPPYGVEFWGDGAQGMNSLVQGNFSNGYVWGFGKAMEISGNYICGPYMTKEGGYIADQQKQPAPVMKGNITTADCKATPSVAPSIAPAAGSYSAPASVTLTTSAENTSIWYTTDGTNPVPGQGTTRFYQGPIALDKTTTIKAVGMWGAANQPLSYPAGYGYVPSNVVSASYVITANHQGL